MGHVYWFWQGTLKIGELDRFNSLVKQWNDIADKDPNTLINEWSICEDNRSVLLHQKFIDSDSAFEQFQINLWDKLDVHLTPNAMHVFGDFGEALEFLKGHGAKFMKPTC